MRIDPSSYKKKSFIRNSIMKAYAAVERFTAKHAAAVITTGPGLAAQVRKMKNCPAVFDIFDIPSSLVEAKAEQVKELRAELKNIEDDVLITYVGSFAVYQGVDRSMGTRIPSSPPTFPATLKTNRPLRPASRIFCQKISINITQAIILYSIYIRYRPSCRGHSFTIFYAM